MEQLRETVAVLHDPAGTEPGAGLPVTDTVEDLLGRAVASGVPVRWEQHGAMPVLSPLVQRGMYRTVQESLTNAVKHAPDGEIRVRISHEATRTRVSVVNAAPPADRPAFAAEGPTIGTGGRGLTGLRERVTVLGGSLWTGPYQDGLRVTAVLPHQVATCPETPTPRPGTPMSRREAAPAPRRPHAGAAHLAPGTDTAVPESVTRLASARNAARRRSVAAFAAPGVAAAFFVPAAVYLAWQLTTSVLPPSRFDELTIGRPRAELAPLLPDHAYPYPPERARSAPQPPGTRCEFYRSGRDLLTEVDLYRLCWSGNMLATKDTVPASRPTVPRPPSAPSRRSRTTAIQDWCRSLPTSRSSYVE